MKDKLGVGMYVRFKDKKGITYIRKIVKLANEYPQKLYGIEIDKEANYSPYLSCKNIIAPSHNKIDLICNGDYVNGKLVVGYGIDNLDRKNIKCGYYDDKYGEVSIRDTFYEEDIKSIVTKEQFKAMEYKIEEYIDGKKE